MRIVDACGSWIATLLKRNLVGDHNWERGNSFRCVSGVPATTGYNGKETTGKSDMWVDTKKCVHVRYLDFKIVHVCLIHRSIFFDTGFYWFQNTQWFIFKILRWNFNYIFLCSRYPLVSYGKSQFMVDFPIKRGDFHSYVKLSEGIFCQDLWDFFVGRSLARIHTILR